MKFETLSDTEIELLNELQQIPIFHGYTCLYHHEGDRMLVAGRLGLKCPTCGYLQKHYSIMPTREELDNMKEFVKRMQEGRLNDI